MAARVNKLGWERLKGVGQGILTFRLVRDAEY
jgi:hypothetical protein